MDEDAYESNQIREFYQAQTQALKKECDFWQKGCDFLKKENLKLLNMLENQANAIASLSTHKIPEEENRRDHSAVERKGANHPESPSPDCTPDLNPLTLELLALLKRND
jgi:hypothetical protein